MIFDKNIAMTLTIVAIGIAAVAIGFYIIDSEHEDQEEDEAVYSIHTYAGRTAYEVYVSCNHTIPVDSKLVLRCGDKTLYSGLWNASPGPHVTATGKSGEFYIDYSTRYSRGDIDTAQIYIDGIRVR